MASEREAIEVEIGGNPLRCPICGTERFHKRRAQLNTAGLTFLGLDWTNPSATCYVCAKCGHVLWFLR